MGLKEQLNFLKTWKSNRVKDNFIEKSGGHVAVGWKSPLAEDFVSSGKNFIKENPNKFLPCPFCGSENIDYAIDRSRQYDEGQVFCKDCEAEGPILISYIRLSDNEIFNEIVNGWNRRV